MHQPEQETKTQTSPSEKPRRTNFERFLELGTKIIVKTPHVEGMENLDGLDSKRLIFATSHLSDADPTIALAALSGKRQMDIASLKTNQQVFGPAVKNLGSERFHDVENTFTGEPHTSFNIADYEEMAAAMQGGKDMLIAAHRPSRNWRLPNNAGVGDVYLAHLIDAPVVPVAVDIHSNEQVGMSANLLGTVRRFLSGNRPEVTVRIGKPVALEKIEPQDLADVGKILMGKRDELKKDDARYQRALQNYEKLRKQSEIVLNAIADMLPPEKQGKWSN